MAQSTGVRRSARYNRTSLRATEGDKAVEKVVDAARRPARTTAASRQVDGRGYWSSEEVSAVLVDR